MSWTAVFKKGPTTQSKDLIFNKIKDRLDDLAVLTFTSGQNIYNLIWGEGIFVVNGARFILHDITKLTNIRPIVFRREAVPVDTASTTPIEPTILFQSLGFQGNDDEGNNVQCYIKIMSDGKFGVHM